MKKTVIGQVTILSFVLMAIFAACTPSLPDYVSDYDLVYTKEAKGFDFSTVHTYFLPDSVVMIADGGGDGDHKYDATILASIKSNLDALGWTQLPDDVSAQADVIDLVSGGTQQYASCTAYCWVSSTAGWHPGWGYHPPLMGRWLGWAYPTHIVCASYSTGTVSVAMTNPNAAADEKLPVVWMGILNGLTEGSASNVQARINTNIDQMFDQSPYLKP